MDTTVRNPTQATSRRQRLERRTAVGAPRADRVVVVGPAVAPVEAAVARTADQRVGRAAVAGGVAGFVLMGAAVFVMSLAAGAEVAGALAIGAFCAFWGGLGFGSMMGAITSTAWEEHRDGRQGTQDR